MFPQSVSARNGAHRCRDPGGYAAAGNSPRRSCPKPLTGVAVGFAPEAIAVLADDCVDHAQNELIQLGPMTQSSRAVHP